MRLFTIFFIFLLQLNCYAEILNSKWNEYTNHWSFNKISTPIVPKIKDKWISNDIDKFILNKQKEIKLLPSIEASKEILIKRIYYDLIGLPPTKEQIDDFTKNKSKSAYSDIINKLLDSPRYGEKWGRIWLDTARYSDTSGTINVNDESRYVYSYTYRDWVINALNEDMPYNKFIIYQIAADVVPDKINKNLAALGFLSLGKNSGNFNDVIDDRMDVIFKGFMGTTIVCARCHDHKSDPFSTKDYYALHGILNNTLVPQEKPLLFPIKEDINYKDYIEKRNKIQKEIDDFIDTKYKAAFNDFKTNTAKWLYSGYVLNTLSNDIRQEYIRKNNLNPRMILKWEQISKTPINVTRRPNKTNSKPFIEKAIPPVFYPYSKMFFIQPENFSLTFQKLIIENKDLINPYLYIFISKYPVNNMLDLAKLYQIAILNCENTNYAGYDGFKEFKDAIFKNNGPLDMNRDNFQRFYANNNITMDYDNTLRQQRGKLIVHELTHPATPPRAMIVHDSKIITNSHVFFKGNPAIKREVAPRKFPDFFYNINTNFYTNGSGRYELALDIINTNNPLTARVIVNRIWQGHFGEGFVRTPDDFGIHTTIPDHLDLMDYLSNYLITNNWSLKSLHRLIMNSSTYKQSCITDSKKSIIDPSNNYLWKMNLYRLSFEELRDTYLSISGQLDLKMGGPSEELFQKSKDTNSSYSVRRTIYGMVDRNKLPEIMTTFDFATPEMTTGKRFKTTVPKQALFLMNNGFILNQSKVINNKPEIKSILSDNDKIIKLYNIILKRNPTKDELNIGLNYINNNYNDQIIWEKYIQILLLTNELIFIG